MGGAGSGSGGSPAGGGLLEADLSADSAPGPAGGRGGSPALGGRGGDGEQPGEWPPSPYSRDICLRSVELRGPRSCCTAVNRRREDTVRSHLQRFQPETDGKRKQMLDVDFFIGERYDLALACSDASIHFSLLDGVGGMFSGGT